MSHLFLKIAESLDSWQRFLQLYAQVMSWCEEKKTFLQEPLQLTSLSETRQKLNVYGVSLDNFFLRCE